MNLIKSVDEAVDFELSASEISILEQSYAVYCPICQDCLFDAECIDSTCPTCHLDLSDSFATTVQVISFNLTAARKQLKSLR